MVLISGASNAPTHLGTVATESRQAQDTISKQSMGMSKVVHLKTSMKARRITWSTTKQAKRF